MKVKIVRTIEKEEFENWSLRVCPFCGKKSIQIHIRLLESGLFGGRCFCSICGAEGPPISKSDPKDLTFEVAEAWGFDFVGRGKE